MLVFLKAFQIKMLKTTNWAGQWWPVFLIRALRKQRRVDLYEFKASLVFRNFQDSQDYTEKPRLKKKKKIKTKQTNKQKPSCTYQGPEC